MPSNLRARLTALLQEWGVSVFRQDQHAPILLLPQRIGSTVPTASGSSSFCTSKASTPSGTICSRLFRDCSSTTAQAVADDLTGAPVQIGGAVAL